MPDVSTIAEAGLPGYAFETWFMVFAPAGRPAAVIDTLNAALRRTLEAPAVKVKLTREGFEPIPSTPADARAAGPQTAPVGPAREGTRHHRGLIVPIIQDLVSQGFPMDTDPLFPGFSPFLIDVGDGVRIAGRTGGRGPALLLLHGHPQTHAIWHRVAPRLAERFTLVMADLRGYGGSSRPPGAADHGNYSKRTMALDMVRLMQALGHARFAVLAHDRGARVAHRMAVDHPDAVERLVLLDVAPTLAMYEQTTEDFARAYWHWFFLIQPAPLPERLIEADPAAYVRDVMGRRSAGLAPFDPRALAAYQQALAQPGSAHALCEDYRASAGIDLEHDRADREAGRKLAQPLQVLWGEQGVVHRCFRPLEAWRQVAVRPEGGPLPCGHYIAEEAPDALLAHALPFLQASTAR